MLKKFLLLLITCFLMCGCSNQTAYEEITFSSWGSQTEVEIIKKVISEFERENPDTKIRFLHIPQNYFQKLHLLIASNQAPDVIFINNLYLPIYQNYLEDLTSIVDVNDYYESSIKGFSFDNKLLAVPRDISTLVLYMNLEGMTLPSPTWNIQDLINYAQKYKAKGLYGISHEDKIYWITPYLSYFGGEILDSNLNLAINSSESKVALNFYKDLQKIHFLAPTKSQVGSLTQAQMFIDGKIGMYLSGRWMYPKIKEKAEFDWAVINFPYGKSPQLSDSSGWAITKGSKNKEISKKFVKYLASKRTADYFVQTGLIVPARKDSSRALDSTKYNEKVFLEILSKTVNTPVSSNYNKIIDNINQRLEL
ncbi:sugar ABC transporter substrate-binding protein [bacterium]|nr:sugar ABC transporter substrate-binding protein [bacterium]